jgi:protein-disulfide isomerase
MKRFLFSIFFIYFLLQTAVFGEDAELKSEIKELRKEVSELRNDIKSLKKLMETRLQKRPSAPQQPTTGKTNINGDPYMGKADAPLVLVEFSDYECFYCARFFRETLLLIRKEYIDTGKLKHVFKDFPLGFHKKAKKAAEASLCAGEEQKYWEMHGLIFENQKQIDIPHLINHAKTLGLKADDFEKCLNDSRYANEIDKDINTGKKIGVRGTPSFILGKINDKGEVEGDFIRGARPYKAFKSALDAMLAKTKTAN